ncbi:hypothetical protein Afil01_49850 [Actinorhabdospora filicis]|uniref:Uncharacterized protein n=1 Tax=Actinorhabdospora filicis TaxID=1785913 RepID=A0A9W6SPW1_9ACTN|nr:hypothetical protein [Actinorhabdospora filicis]GLZ80178.1 hypothetical protein Afil01_49850 [Actinorhabdospora filicis]
MKRHRPALTGALIWLATTGVAVLVAWLGLHPVLAAAVPNDGLPVELGEPDASPSAWPTADSATSRAEPLEPGDGWHYLAEGVWERSIHAEGGTLTVRAFDGRVALIAATPRDGYAMIVDDRDPAHLMVIFRSGDGGESFADVRWLGDGPYAAVTER